MARIGQTKNELDNADAAGERFHQDHDTIWIQRKQVQNDKRRFQIPYNTVNQLYSMKAQTQHRCEARAGASWLSFSFCERRSASSASMVSIWSVASAMAVFFSSVVVSQKHLNLREEVNEIRI